MKIVTLWIVMLLLAGCSDDGVPVPPDIPVDQLLAVPDTVIVNARALYLTTYLWRDFQPISPPGGKPLIAVVQVTATDTARLPGSISVDALWITYGREVWKSWLANEPIGYPERPNRIVMVARDGPAWGPHVSVDVIVRVADGRGGAVLLRAPNQWISRTD